MHYIPAHLETLRNKVNLLSEFERMNNLHIKRYNNILNQIRKINIEYKGLNNDTHTTNK